MGHKSTCKLLIIALTALCLAGCGTTTTSGATASTPTSVPTTIEYASGDAIISGSIAGGASANFAKGTIASGIPENIYAITPFTDKVEATIEENCFFLSVPTGSTYALVFSYTDGVKYYSDSELSLASIPLSLLAGVGNSGSSDFVDCELSSGDASAPLPSKADDSELEELNQNGSAQSLNTVSIVNLGAVSVSDSVINRGVDTATFLDEINMTAADAMNVGRFDGPFTAYANENYLAGGGDSIVINYNFWSTGEETDIIDSFLSPALWQYEGYNYDFYPPNATMSSSATLMLSYAGVDAVGVRHPADVAVSSCFDTNVRHTFFCYPGYLSEPAAPQTGTFTAQESGLDAVSFVFRKVQDHAGIESLEDVPIVSLRANTSGGSITSVSWQWIIKESGSWRDMTYDEVMLFAAMITPGNVPGYAHFNVLYTDGFVGTGIGINDSSDGSDVTSASGTVSISPAVPVADYTGMTVDYTDIAGYYYYMIY